MIVESENASSQQDRGKKVAFVSSLSNNISSTFSAFVKVRKWRAIAKPDRIIKFVFFSFSFEEKSNLEAKVIFINRCDRDRGQKYVT